MTTWGVTRRFLALTLVVGACAGGHEAVSSPATTPTTTTSTTSTTAPERPVSTTTTAFDPASIEGQVEAAYLRSWDVYADAVYNLKLDESALASVYAGDHLKTVIAELTRRVNGHKAALVRVDHHYTIQLQDGVAYVVDRLRNHQVLIDPTSKRPVEVDPDQSVADLVTLEEEGQVWRVVRVQELH